MFVISPDQFGALEADFDSRAAVAGAQRLRAAEPAETQARTDAALVTLWADCAKAAANLGWRETPLVDRLALIVLRAKGRPPALLQAAFYAGLTKDESPAEVRLAFCERQLT